MTTFAAAEPATLSQDPDHGAFVALYLVKKKPDLPYKTFREYEIETHAPLAMALPGLLDYRLIFFPPNDGAPQSFDALARLTFETKAAHDAALGSEAGQTALADLPNVIDVNAMVPLYAGASDAHVGTLPTN